jgi:hypothetical protein
MEIPLHSAPEKLFDPLLWAFFEMRFDCHQDALAAISQEPSTISPLIASATSKASNIDRWQDGTPPYDIRRMLINELHYALRNSDLVATGIKRGDPSSARRKLKVSEISGLWFEFDRDAAHSVLNEYAQVRISKNEKKETPEALTQLCINFLKDLRGKGLTNKVLKHEFEEHVGLPVPDKIFRFAMKSVFNRKPGRPRSKS